MITGKPPTLPDGWSWTPEDDKARDLCAAAAGEGPGSVAALVLADRLDELSDGSGWSVRLAHYLATWKPVPDSPEQIVPYWKVCAPYWWPGDAALTLYRHPTTVGHAALRLVLAHLIQPVVDAWNASHYAGRMGCVGSHPDLWWMRACELLTGAGREPVVIGETRELQLLRACALVYAAVYFPSIVRNSNAIYGVFSHVRRARCHAYATTPDRAWKVIRQYCIAALEFVRPEYARTRAPSHFGQPAHTRDGV